MGDTANQTVLLRKKVSVVNIVLSSQDKSMSRTCDSDQRSSFQRSESGENVASHGMTPRSLSIMSLVGLSDRPAVK